MAHKIVNFIPLLYIIYINKEHAGKLKISNHTYYVIMYQKNRDSSPLTISMAFRHNSTLQSIVLNCFACLSAVQNSAAIHRCTIHQVKAKVLKG